MIRDGGEGGKGGGVEMKKRTHASRVHHSIRHEASKGVMKLREKQKGTSRIGYGMNAR